VGIETHKKKKKIAAGSATRPSATAHIAMTIRTRIAPPNFLTPCEEDLKLAFFTYFVNDN